MSTGKALFVLLMLVAFGCAIEQWAGFESAPSGQQYRANKSCNDNQWIGRQLDELLESRGQPDRVIEAPPCGASRWHSGRKLAYVYHPENEPGAGCVDAFVVTEEDGLIVDYHCR